MAKLKARLPSLDGLDETTQAFYEKNGEGFVLAVEPVDGWALEDVVGLKTTSQDRKDKIGRLQSRLDAYGDLDPEEARHALENADKKFADHDEALKEAERRFAKKIADAEAARDAALAQHDKALMRGGLDEAFREAGVRKDRHRALRAMIERDYRVVEENGERYLRILDDEGKARITAKEGSSSYMDALEHVKSLKGNDEYSFAFEGAGAAGGGTPSGGSPGSHGTNLSDLPARERLAHAFESGSGS